MLALFTNVGASGTASWNVPKSGYSGNTQLIDVLSCTNVTTNGDGSLTARTTNGSPQVYLPLSALSASNVCGNSPGSSGAGNSASGGAMPSLMLVGLASFAYLLMGVGL
jgi:alpha-amylase